MEEFSYDGTEQTPLPKMFRPPPMHPQQTNTFSSAIGNDASQAQTATGAESNRLLQVSSALRHTDESILSYSMLEEAADETLPSFPVQPPSPAQNPGNSLLGEDFSHIGTPAGPLPFTSSKNDFQKPRDRVHNHTTPMTTATTVGSSQTRPYTATQPPISEVHVEKSHQESSSDHDTFFECLEDQSIAQRARRSMQRQTPPAAPPSSNQRQYSTNSNNNNITNNNTSHIPFHIDSLSLSPSMTSSFWTMEQPQDFTPQEQRQSNQRHQFTPDTASESNIPPTPSPVQVSQVHESALQALLRLKEELIKSNKKNQTLIAQNKALKEDGQKQQVHWQSKIQNLQDELSNVQESLDASSKTLQDERQSWTTEKEQLAEKLRTVTRERKEAMHRKVASENRSKELKHQLEQTKADLDQTTQEHAQLAQKYSALSREKAKVEQEKFQLESKLATLTSSQAQQTKEEVRELSQLRADLQAKDQTIASLKSSLEEANRLRQQDYQKYQADAQNWQQRYKNDTQLYKTQLERLKTALHNAATPRSSEYAVTPTPTHNNSGKTLHTVPTQQQDPTPPLESSIADRLARMRDSAERAQLIKAHKRDLARIKLEYDQQIQKLISNHQEVLRKTKEEADAVLASQLDTLKKTLSQDYYQKLQEAEAQHQEKFTKMQQEYMESQEAADDSLQSALAKISTLTQQYEREMNRRGNLERSIQQLHQEMEQEQKQLLARHAEELARRRAEWETERDTLLTVIQKDCNSAFEQQRQQHQKQTVSAPAQSAAPTQASPARSRKTRADSDAYSKLTVDTSEAALGTPANRPPSLVSPAYSEIDDVIRETEHLIQSIM